MNQQRPPTRRTPLGEATKRVNNAQQHDLRSMTKHSPLPHHESLRQDGLIQSRSSGPASPLSQGDYYPMRDVVGFPGSNAVNPRVSAVSKEYPNSNRNSQISTVSTNASDGKKIKARIGPWKLGRTLGKGATARVRLARHTYTGQAAAVKIVQKKNAQLSQAGSLAALDKAEAKMPDPRDGLRRMPVGIEREVAIMKLIQHPNIMKLHDIWENRTEIYLVLEFVDNGELFEHISSKGGLQEEEAIKYFRQILSAVGYCHSFNICHRDLKPENILLTKSLDIKIADFGMAALHQSPDHKLKTSCGSPHYAAPELIRGVTYRGDKVDIWSMGVILYASLAGRLPFDVEGSGKDWLSPLLNKIKKGSFEMAPEFSPDAANLIWRILQVNPRDRINLIQIWKHPLIRKYDYLDNLGGGGPLSPSLKSYDRPVLRRSDISKEILRHLRSLWHQLNEGELMDALLSEEPNDQKLFYGLFLKYRDEQLENYMPDVGYSASDYHHVRPINMTKTYSTCHFPQPKQKGHGRQISRFTVISNVAETEQSYDPFKASRPQRLDSNRASDRARITIHCTDSSAIEKQDLSMNSTTKIKQPSHTSLSVTGNSSRGRRLRNVNPRVCASRSSLASSTRSRQSAPYMRVPIGHKRGVDFSHMRKHSGGSNKNSFIKFPVALERHSNHTEVTDDGGSTLRALAETPASTRYIRSRKTQMLVSQTRLPAANSDRQSQFWSEDVRQLSSSLAKDCDEAFNRSSVAPTTKERSRSSVTLSTSQQSLLGREREPSPLSSLDPGTTTIKIKHSKHFSLDHRPLPPPPVRSDSVRFELLEARKQAQLRKKSGDDPPGYLDRMVSHIDKLILPTSPTNTHVDRRSISAPVDAKRAPSNCPLPSIFEVRKEEESPLREKGSDRLLGQQAQSEAKTSRIASAPEARVLHKNNRNDRLVGIDNNTKPTIRVVMPCSPQSPVKIPAPLTIRKKSSQGGPDKVSYANRHRQMALDIGRQNNSESRMEGPDLGCIDEGQANENFICESNPGTIVKKKPTWFRRNSKTGDDQDWGNSIGGVDTVPSQSSSNDTVRPSLDLPLPFLPKKKFSFGRLFKKRNSQPDMSVAPYEEFDETESISDSAIDAHRNVQVQHGAHPDGHKSRQIEPQRNWLAKLFNVKPASKFICFSVSKQRARQEVVTIFKEWKRYGMKDVQVDKSRNIVFGRVAAKNYLDLREVAFAGEIMTVIEHGRRSHLSIARFTQERGAASSFHKVVETLEGVLKCRGMLIGDERKRRMMVKTLRSA